MTLIRILELIAGYGNRAVVSGASFEVAGGEILALIGPNGGGKSTLLKAIGDGTPLMAGDVHVNGQSLAGRSQRERARLISFVPQEEPWLFEFTVRELVAMARIPASNGFFETEEDRNAADSAMAEAGCSGLSNRIGLELSGGERQRVLIARALAQQTPVLLLDEPTAHLDPNHQIAACELIRNLADRGKAIIVAIHDLPMVTRIANSVCIVSEGGISEKLTPSAALDPKRLEDIFGNRFELVSSPSGILVPIAI